jgi:hypothetical protein
MKNQSQPSFTQHPSTDPTEVHTHHLEDGQQVRVSDRPQIPRAMLRVLGRCRELKLRVAYVAQLRALGWRLAHVPRHGEALHTARRHAAACCQALIHS